MNHGNDSNSQTIELSWIPISDVDFRRYGQVIEAGSNHSERWTNQTLYESGKLKLPDGCNPASEDLDVFDYWSNVADLTIDNPKLGYMTPYEREFETGLLEQHRLGTQAFVNCGPSSLGIIVAAPFNHRHGSGFGLPDLESLRAVVFGPGEAINLMVGTWHWTPFPINGPSSLITLIRKNAAQDDLHFVCLESVYGLRIVVSSVTDN